MFAGNKAKAGWMNARGARALLLTWIMTATMIGGVNLDAQAQVSGDQPGYSTTYSPTDDAAIRAGIRSADIDVGIIGDHFVIDVGSGGRTSVGESCFGIHIDKITALMANGETLTMFQPYVT